MAETLSRGHRPTPEKEEDVTNLVQEERRHKPGSHRRRTPVEEGETNTQIGDEQASSSNIPLVAGERNTRRDPIPGKEHLTPEDWAIMAALERCTVWRSLKSLNLRQGEKLLAAICMVFQETVEGNANRSTVYCQRTGRFP